MRASVNQSWNDVYPSCRHAIATDDDRALGLRWPDCTLSRHAARFRRRGPYSDELFRRPRGTQSVAVPSDAFPRQLRLKRFRKRFHLELVCTLASENIIVLSSKAFRRSCPRTAAAAISNIDRFLPTCVRHRQTKKRMPGAQSDRAYQLGDTVPATWTRGNVALQSRYAVPRWCVDSHAPLDALAPTAACCCPHSRSSSRYLDSR
jgi:hypothetical protein